MPKETILELFQLLLDKLPAWVGVVFGHCARDLIAVGTEVLVIHPTLLVHDERHHPRVSPLFRIRDQNESSNHVPINYVIVLATGGSWSLSCDDFKIISVIRMAGTLRALLFGLATRALGLGAPDVRSGLGAISFGARIRNKLAKRAWLFVISRGPVKPVLLPGRTEKSLTVLGHAIVVTVALRKIFPLREDVGAARCYRRELVVADPAIQDFIEPRLRIEKPPVSSLHDWNWHRPTIFPNEKLVFGVTVFSKLREFLQSFGKVVQIVVVFHRIARE